MSIKSLKHFRETGRIRKLELAIFHLENPVEYQQGEVYPYGAKSSSSESVWMGEITILTFRVKRDEKNKGKYIRYYDFSVRYSDKSFSHREDVEEGELDYYIRVGHELKNKKK